MLEIVTRDNQPGIEIAAVRHLGAYAGIGQSFGRLMTLLAAAGVAPTGAAVAIYYDDPSQVPAADLRAHAGIIVPPSSTLSEGLERIAIPAGRAAVITLKGPYSAIPAAWAHMYEWLATADEVPGGHPPYEIYLNDMATTAPGDLLTEIVVPLQS